MWHLRGGRRDAPGGDRRVRADVVPRELRRVAQAFRDLQEARHDADYGTDRVWTKTEAITEVERAEQAFQDWSAIHRRASAAPVVRLFLAWLGFQKKLQAR